MAHRRDVKSIAAMNDHARHARVHANMDDVGARFESTLQRQEISIAAFPSRDFDTNSARRQVDHDRASRSVQWCSPPESGWLKDQSRATLHAPEESIMTNHWSCCRRREPTAHCLTRKD